MDTAIGVVLAHREATAEFEVSWLRPPRGSTVNAPVGTTTWITAAKLAEDAPQLIEIALYLRRRTESTTNRDVATEPFSHAHTASIREQLDAHYVRQALEYLEASVSAGYAPFASLIKTLVRQVLQEDAPDAALCTRLYALLRHVHSTVGVLSTTEYGEGDDPDDLEEPEYKAALLVEALAQCQHPSRDLRYQASLLVSYLASTLEDDLVERQAALDTCQLLKLLRGNGDNLREAMKGLVGALVAACTSTQPPALPDVVHACLSLLHQVFVLCACTSAGIDFPCANLVERLVLDLRQATLDGQLVLIEGLRSAWLKAQLLERMLGGVVDPASWPLEAQRVRARTPSLSIERIVFLYFTALPLATATATVPRIPADGSAAPVTPVDWFVYLVVTLTLAYVEYIGPFQTARDAELLQQLPAIIAAFRSRLQGTPSAASVLSPASAPPRSTRGRPARAASAASAVSAAGSPETAAPSDGLPLLPAWADTLTLLEGVMGVGA